MILVLHAALQLIQDRWPEHGVLLVESCSWQTHEDGGNKLNSSTVLISLQPSSAAAVSCAFLSVVSHGHQHHEYGAFAPCYQVPSVAPHAHYCSRVQEGVTFPRLCNSIYKEPTYKKTSPNSQWLCATFWLWLCFLALCNSCFYHGFIFHKLIFLYIHHSEKLSSNYGGFVWSIQNRQFISLISLRWPQRAQGRKWVTA